MSDLTYAEKKKLEDMFGMETGYVLGFSDRTFREFVHDSTGKDLYDQAGTYRQGSGSKANRLRAFWHKEDNHLVGKLLGDLLDHCRKGCRQDELVLFEECRQIAERLRQGAPVADLSALVPSSADRDFDTVAAAAKGAIDNNEPQSGVDRLHTFMMFFVRRLCTERGIPYDRDTPLHSLFGGYVKQLREAGQIESEMASRILRSCTSTLDAFNDVRNHKSLAHANRILNYDEALFIYNHVCSTVRYVQALERKHAQPSPQAQRPTWLRQAP